MEILISNKIDERGIGKSAEKGSREGKNKANGLVWGLKGIWC